IEVKLRQGLTRNGIYGKTQDDIVLSISSFALYGFPESHAASFALIAYASAYLKCNYLAAFTAAILNNQPMGFYQPFTIIKDAQRHGLKVLPVDITQSSWECTIEKDVTHIDNLFYQLRLGLLCVKGLREEAGRAIVRTRAQAPFSSLDDLRRRVPELRKLAAVGALNLIQTNFRSTQVPKPVNMLHARARIEGHTNRRDALWQVE